MRLVPRSEVADGATSILHLSVLEGDGTWSAEVPLRCLESESGTIVLASRDPEPRWSRVLSGTQHARWRVDGRTSAGPVEPVEDSGQLERFLGSFGARFGSDQVLGWFPRGVRGYRLRARRESPSTYQREVEAYFDRIAPQYDAAIEANPLDRAMRAVSGDALASAFRRDELVLEIGCGTGWETLPLARRGVRVLATDVSSEMLARLNARASADGLSTRIETRKLAAEDLATLLQEFAPGSFDGAFSDFGALNCEADTDGIPDALHRLVRPGGRVVLGIWNRFCAAEAMLSLVALHPDRALARLETPVPVGRSRYGVPVYARAAGEFLDAFRPFFEVERMTGLPVFVPPYEFARGLAAHSNLLPILERLDATLAGRFPFNRLGDHFLVVLRRRP